MADREGGLDGRATDRGADVDKTVEWHLHSLHETASLHDDGIAELEDRVAELERRLDAMLTAGR